MDSNSGRVSTPIRSPTDKDSRTLTVNRTSDFPFEFRRAMLSPPTGQLRRDSTGSLSPDDDITLENLDNDEDWDTDLETDDCKEEYDVTGRTTYIQACREAGVIPASFFLRNMQESDVDIKHHGLGPMGAKAISIALVSNTSVIKLNLRDNWLGADGASFIAEMLRENCYISDLDMSENRLGDRGAECLGDILVHNSNILRLTASGNGFEDKAAGTLAESIKTNTTVKYLCLSHNRIGEKGGQLLAPALAANDALTELDLSWNHLRGKGACALALSLKENITLKILNLAWNGFGNDGALAMGEALKVNSSLLELDLTNNRITAEGAVHLAKGLMVNTTLQVLKVGKNPMQSAGAYAIVNSMKNNPECALVEVELTDINVNNDFIELCKEVLLTRPNVRISHGGSGGALSKPKGRPSPMKILKNYIVDNRMRLLDFFNTLDKDKSMSISIKEFADGLKETGIDMKYEELFTLIETLDKNKDGEINYSELVMGSIEQVIEDRKEKIKEQAADERRRHISGEHEDYPECYICYGRLKEPFIRCSECHPFVQLCLANNSFCILEENWTAQEEMQLLDAVGDCGIGNWAEVSKQMQTKTNKECERHYIKCYIQDAKQNGLPATEDPPRPPMDSFKSVELAGYMPCRGDFEVEYDNYAEFDIKDITLDPTDSLLLQELKLAAVQVFINRLKQRWYRKKIVQRYGLINIKKWQMLERRQDKAERDLRDSLRPFARLQSSDEHEKLVQGMQLENYLKREILSLQEYRMAGIKTKKVVQQYTPPTTRLS
ncbi:Leucine-rich repeat-containing protein 74A [Exaiptasia diaphana]|nr:Leucine-rich repeat-containing protein 74A [Exaiptasia diaphana]